MSEQEIHSWRSAPGDFFPRWAGKSPGHLTGHPTRLPVSVREEFEEDVKSERQICH